MKELSFHAPPALAVAEGATTPVPSIGAGAVLWSTTAAKLLVWNGSAWAATAQAGGGGGGLTTGRATVDFGTGKTEASATVTGQAAVTATTRIDAALRCEATAVNSVDDILLDPVDVVVSAISAGVGFTLLARSRAGRNFGTYIVDWAY